MSAKTPEWDAIRDEYVTTRITQSGLVRKYGLRWRELKQHSIGEGWVRLREEHRAALSEERGAAARRVDLDYKGTIYETAFRMAAQLRDLVASGNVAEMGLRPRDVTGALKDIADILAIKSDADVAEQQARIDKLRADAARAQESDEGKEITVRIEGAPEAWSE